MIRKNVKNGIFVNVSVMYQFLKNGIVVIVRLDHIPNALYCYFFYKYCYLHCKYVDMYIVQ